MRLAERVKNVRFTQTVLLITALWTERKFYVPHFNKNGGHKYFKKISPKTDKFAFFLL
jgi:hypothetical protein